MGGVVGIQTRRRDRPVIVRNAGAVGHFGGIASALYGFGPTWESRGLSKRSMMEASFATLARPVMATIIPFLRDSVFEPTIIPFLRDSVFA
jgi:hypothetical protein